MHTRSLYLVYLLDESVQASGNLLRRPRCPLTNQCPLVTFVKLMCKGGICTLRPRTRPARYSSLSPDPGPSPSFAPLSHA